MRLFFCFVLGPVAGFAADIGKLDCNRAIVLGPGAGVGYIIILFLYKIIIFYLYFKSQY
jgi:hypothetical protein